MTRACSRGSCSAMSARDCMVQDVGQTLVSENGFTFAAVIKEFDGYQHNDFILFSCPGEYQFRGWLNYLVDASAHVIAVFSLHDDPVRASNPHIERGVRRDNVSRAHPLSDAALRWPRLALPMLGNLRCCGRLVFSKRPGGGPPICYGSGRAGTALPLWASPTSSLGMEMFAWASPGHGGDLRGISWMVSSSSSGRWQLRNAPDRRQWRYSHLGTGQPGARSAQRHQGAREANQLRNRQGC